MPKGKLWKLDPPTKTVTIHDVPSEIVNEFNQLTIDKKRIMSIEQGRKVSKSEARTEVFKEMVLGKRKEKGGEGLVQSSIKDYFRGQERRKQLNEHTLQQREQDSLS
ncbi:hypothetical protein AB835_10845 [Candidatus Endobugula sertula]|uniref:Uncharacterized protein n=1 Tax=Candidatus Endobugula sertula TaxID=62101 RepID=A0A1D2QN79_9GAMM|nr:hypothetical protein AB835_10845 [Candidatus Endobugula sertula]